MITRNKLAYTIALLSFAVSGESAPIPILNSSFEEPVQAPGGFVGFITGWTVSGGGVWDPSGPWAGTLGPVPDGKQVGWINSGQISQTLGAVLEPNTKYVLSIAVGARNDIGNPGVNYFVELLAGSTVVATATQVAPPVGSWIDISGEFVSPSIVVADPLTVRIRISASQFDFDNVRLTADQVDVPEGGTCALLMMTGLCGLAGFRKFAL